MINGSHFSINLYATYPLGGMDTVNSCFVSWLPRPQSLRFLLPVPFKIACVRDFGDNCGGSCGMIVVTSIDIGSPPDLFEGRLPYFVPRNISLLFQITL
ncbi:hypothetical protein TNCV_3674871 [Trichonephila clavipes]|nr:hypothetical protein TNCV_3674871 [Trichonephila clavipes]